MLSGIRGRSARFLALAASIAVGCAVTVACSLNPQPIPPGVTSAADAGTAAPPNLKANDPEGTVDAGIYDSPSANGDGGATSDASQVVDHDATDGLDDAGDAATDAPTDALADGGD